MKHYLAVNSMVDLVHFTDLQFSKCLYFLPDIYQSVCNQENPCAN